MWRKYLLSTFLAYVMITPARAGWLSELHKPAPLPPELAGDVDVIRMPRAYKIWDPLNFPPYRVSKYRFGAERQRLTRAPTLSFPPIAIGLEEVVEHSIRRDTIVLDFEGREALRGDCSFVKGLDDATGGVVDVTTCTLEAPTGSAWTLEFGGAAEPGETKCSGELDSPGRLCGEEGAIEVDYLYNNRTPLGPLRAGYLFTIDGIPVAALQCAAASPDGELLAPRRLTMKRSLTAEQRSAIAATVAVLWIGRGIYEVGRSE